MVLLLLARALVPMAPLHDGWQGWATGWAPLPTHAQSLRPTHLAVCSCTGKSLIDDRSKIASHWLLHSSGRWPGLAFTKCATHAFEAGAFGVLIALAVAVCAYYAGSISCAAFAYPCVLCAQECARSSRAWAWTAAAWGRAAAESGATFSWACARAVAAWNGWMWTAPTRAWTAAGWASSTAGWASSTAGSCLAFGWARTRAAAACLRVAAAWATSAAAGTIGRLFHAASCTFAGCSFWQLYSALTTVALVAAACRGHLWLGQALQPVPVNVFVQCGGAGLMPVRVDEGELVCELKQRLASRCGASAGEPLPARHTTPTTPAVWRPPAPSALARTTHDKPLCGPLFTVSACGFARARCHRTRVAVVRWAVAAGRPAGAVSGRAQRQHHRLFPPARRGRGCAIAVWGRRRG